MQPADHEFPADPLDGGIQPLTVGARLTTRRRQGCLIAAVTGRVDLASVTPLRERLHGQVYAGAQAVVLDLSGVTFVDSVGLSMLIGLRRILSARGGNLHLAACSPAVAELLELTMLTRTFTLHATVAGAEAAIAAGPLPD